jgi:serine/threonine-protein kinase
MTTTELGACEWFVWDLRRSNLIDRGQLDQFVSEFLKKNSRAEPPALAQYLIDQGILTPFQAERLLQGKSQGLVLGPYTLMDALGAGSMGTVYKALSRNDNQWYAVKSLPRRSMWNVRIARRQVRAFEQLHHPAVVPFVDVGTAGGTHYLAWPLVEGETIESLVVSRGPMAPGVAAHFTLQAAEGLEPCHQQSIIHGLLKPSNLLVGADQQLRILDFGIGSILANSEGESLVDTMSTANSLTSGLDCASPESIIDPSNRTPAGDQYSLGCVLYYMLTGRYPFHEGSAVEKMMWHQTRRPTAVTELNPEVPSALAAVVDRLMQKDPDARFTRTQEVVEALRPLVSTGGLPTNGHVLRPAGTNVSPTTGTAQRPLARSRQRQDEGLSTTPVRERAVAPVLAPRPLPSGPPVTMAAGFPKGGARLPLPHLIPAHPKDSSSFEERFGAMGVFVGAVMAAGVTWLLSLWLFK